MVRLVWVVWVVKLVRVFWVVSKVVGFDHLFRNPPSKPSNVQVDEGLFQAKLILKAITTSSLTPKSKKCHWGNYKMKYLTSPNMTISFY